MDRLDLGGGAPAGTGFRRLNKPAALQRFSSSCGEMGADFSRSAAFCGSGALVGQPRRDKILDR